VSISHVTDILWLASPSHVLIQSILMLPVHGLVFVLLHDHVDAEANEGTVAHGSCESHSDCHDVLKQGVANVLSMPEHETASSAQSSEIKARYRVRRHSVHIPEQHQRFIKPVHQAIVFFLSRDKPLSDT